MGAIAVHPKILSTHFSHLFMGFYPKTSFTCLRWWVSIRCSVSITVHDLEDQHSRSTSWRNFARSLQIRSCWPLSTPVWFAPPISLCILPVLHSQRLLANA